MTIRVDKTEDGYVCRVLPEREWVADVDHTFNLADLVAVGEFLKAQFEPVDAPVVVDAPV
jgi:hypothetical protein